MIESFVFLLCFVFINVLLVIWNLLLYGLNRECFLFCSINVLFMFIILVWCRFVIYICLIMIYLSGSFWLIERFFLLSFWFKIWWVVIIFLLMRSLILMFFIMVGMNWVIFWRWEYWCVVVGYGILFMFFGMLLYLMMLGKFNFYVEFNDLMKYLWFFFFEVVNFFV